MKRVLSLLLLVSCLFNCAASSFAEEYMLYEEPSEVLTDEEFVTERGEELIVGPETETLVGPDSIAPAGLLDESDILIPQQHPENDIMPAQTQEENLTASDSFSADETATPAYQDLTLDLGVNGDSYESGFVYNDSFLLKDNTTMSPELAKASIALASSAYVTVGDPPSSLYSALEKMGYTVDKADGNWNRTHMVDDNDFVRYVIATKPIMDGDVEHIVYCLVIQGTRGGYDWDSDFNIGTEDDHYGFYTAREEIVNKLCDMMEHDGKSSSERILWTMGHSRGAAVSNIVAGEFTMGHSEAAPFSTLSELIHGDRIYSYNFACPSVSKRDDVRQAHMNGICPNIFNFNSPHDVIPTLPLEDWGYVRYGIDVPVNIGSANFRQRFESEKSYSYNGTEKTVSYLPTIINRGIPNSATANTPTRQLIFKAIALAMKDGDTITLKTILETLMFYFMDNGEQIIQNYAENYVLSESGLAEPLSYAETIEQLSIKSTKYLRETENMSQEEFSAWLNENHSEVEDLEQWAHYQIGSRKDLEDVWKIFEANSLAKITGFEGIDAGDAEALLECGVALWVYFHDGGSFSAIGDGHDWMSYLIYINEEYYGYRGWYQYNGNAGITLSDDQNIETIGEECFYKSTISVFDAEGNSLRYIGSSAFRESDLSTANLGDGIEWIGNYGFGYCHSLCTLYIPAGLTISSTTIFEDCINLWEVHYTGSGEMADYPLVTLYNGLGFVYYMGVISPWYYCRLPLTIVIEDGVTSISKNAFHGCYNLADITIPNSVTSIGESAFEGCIGLTEINIPDNVTSIGEEAFYECSGLTGTLTIPDSVTSIGVGAFYGCSGLTGTLTIPGSVASIGSLAFENCVGLKNLTIEKGVMAIGEEAFVGCSGLTGTLTIPDSVTSMGEFAFSGCSGLTGTLTIQGSVGDSAFAGCTGLTEIQLSAGLVYGRSAFEGCTGVDTVHLTGNGEMADYRDYQITGYYSSYALWYYLAPTAGVLTVVIDEGVTTISDLAFYKCKNPINVIIGDSVTSIGRDAFRDCSGLRELTIENVLTAIEDGMLQDCNGLTKVNIPNSVTSIGAMAFAGCSGLTKIDIPNSVTSIGEYAFSGCSGLTEINIPNSVTSIGERSFAGCSGLTGTLTIPDSVTSIGEFAFSECSGLTKIDIPNSVTSIGGSAFSGCTSLAGIDIPNSVTSIGEFTFSECSGLTEIDIPNSVTSIGDFAFSGCTSLAEINIPSSVAKIRDKAFEDCHNLKTVFVKGQEPDTPQFGIDVFDGCSSELKFFCFINSAAAKYAQENGFAVELWDNTAHIELSLFPDEVFREYVRSNIDINADGVLEEKELSAVKSISVAGSAITSLRGIEVFTALETLDCADNQLTELNLADLGALTSLNCADNQLTELNLADLSVLTSLNCADNQLTELSLIGAYALESLDCANNQIAELTTYCPMKTLNCSHNQLTELWLTERTAIVTLNCADNLLTRLDLSSCSKLTAADCSHNQIISLDLNGCIALQSLDFSHNQLWSWSAPDSALLRELNCSYNQLWSMQEDAWPELRVLNCAHNKMTNLALSGYPLLTILHCEGNTINTLNLVSLPGLAALVNGTAPTAESDHLLYTDGSLMLTVEPNVALIASVQSIVPLDAAHFPDAVFRNALEPCDTNGDGIFSNLEISEIESLYLTGDIASLRGIEYLSFLRELDTYNTKLQSVNLSNNQTLENIKFSDCPLLTSLDVSGCPRLSVLICYRNALKNLNFSQCPAMEQIYCSDNRLEVLDLSDCPELMCLYCYNNLLTTLDLSRCPILSSVVAAVEPEYAEWANGDLYYIDSGEIALDTGVELIAPALKLPGFLTAIESEAFVNTGASVVIIPPTVTEIADDAFSRVCVVGVQGSEAEAYAARKGFTFVPYEK